MHVVFARRLFAAILRSLWQHFGSKANDSPEHISNGGRVCTARKKSVGLAWERSCSSAFSEKATAGCLDGWLQKIISSRNNKGNAENASRLSFCTVAPFQSHFPPNPTAVCLPALAPLTSNFRRLGLRPSTSCLTLAPKHPRSRRDWLHCDVSDSQRKRLGVYNSRFKTLLGSHIKRWKYIPTNPTLKSKEVWVIFVILVTANMNDIYLGCEIEFI